MLFMTIINRTYDDERKNNNDTVLQKQFTYYNQYKHLVISKICLEITKTCPGKEIITYKIQKSPINF